MTALGAPGREDAVVGALDEILMVEDSPTDAELALRAFKLAAFANPVVVATSGEAGLDYLLGTGAYADRGPTRPRMILLDLNLPKMSGVDFLHRVRAEGRTRDIPVIILSLSERDRDVTACIHLGAEAYLVKPVNFENFARIATGLKVRLTLVERPRHGRSSGWILSGSPAPVEARPAAAPAAPGSDH
ncbi:MAG: response regulator [Verrucomicrobia bacterium]|nr:response regulator [Verrucomicrobiota bacterium]